jgi:hypothetical protein
MSQLDDHQPSDVNMDRVIEDAMRTVPLATPPINLYPVVMARVNAVDRLPQFRLTWLDYTAGVLLAAMVGALVFPWLYLPRLLPSRAPAADQIKTIETLATAQPLDPIAQWSVLCGTGVLFVMLVAALIINWTRPVAYKVRR